MSIAMTVVIAPSRRLHCLLAGFGAGLIAAAWVVLFSPSLRFAGKPVVAFMLLLAGACLVHAACRRATAHRLDISGPGQLRLTVQQGVRGEAGGARPVAILPHSTLWPQLLVLRCGGVGGGGERRLVRSVLVLPDSVAPEAFSALTVALGVASRHPGVASTERKIL
jgi:hypothetical protein